MSTTPATQVAYSFVTAGSATQYTIPQWIQEGTDVSVYFGTTLQLSSSYTITGISSAGYTLTFSTAPADGTTVFIFRSIIIDEPPQFSPGAAITETDLNNINNNFYLENIDADYKLANLSFLYDRTLLTTDGTLTDAMRTFPKPVAPSGGISTVMAWNGTAWESVPIASTGSAAALKLELASTSSPTGASLIGYSASSGFETVENALGKCFEVASSPTTGGATHIECYFSGAGNSMQGYVDLLTNNPATASNASGSAHVSYWNGSSSVSVQAQIDDLRLPATGVSTSGATNIPAWNADSGAASSVQGLLNSLLAVPDASNFWHRFRKALERQC